MKKIIYFTSFFLLLSVTFFQQNSASDQILGIYSGEELRDIYNKKYSFYLNKMMKEFEKELEIANNDLTSYKKNLQDYYVKNLFFDYDYRFLLIQFLNLLKTMNGPFRGNENDYAYYQRFLTSLRSALNNKYYLNHNSSDEENGDPSNVIWGLNKVIKIMYTKITLYDYKDALVYQLSKYKDRNYQQYINRDNDQEDIYQKIRISIDHHLDIYKGLVGHGNIEKKLEEKVWKKLKNLARSSMFNNFDPSLEGNISSVKMILHSEVFNKNIFNIRMGTPTIGNTNYLGTSISFNEEFLGFLKYLKQNDKNHLYINYQIRKQELKRSFGVANETPRALFLEEEGNKLNNLTVISLDKDSPYYHQSRMYNNPLIDSKVFMKQYFEQLLLQGKSAVYHFPNKLTSIPGFKTKVDQVLNFIWINFFDSKEVLTVNERKSFIDISYILIPQFILKKFDYYNRTCKDGIDRAGSENALEFSLLLFVSLQDNPQHFNEYFKYFERMLFTDALFTRHREVKKDRLNRYLMTLKTIVRNFQKDPQLGAKIIDLTGIKSFSFL